MHVLIFLDQHPKTLGGAQRSILLQRQSLESLGHHVTLCAPASPLSSPDDDVVTLPSLPLGVEGGYRFIIPNRRADRLVDEAVAQLPPVDVVHIQADFWGAITGISFARRHHLPSVLTFHNNVVVGTQAVAGVLLTKLYIRWMASLLSRRIKEAHIQNRSDGWQYLAELGRLVTRRTAPTRHFAKTLSEHGVEGEITAISNGIDDRALTSIPKPVRDKTVTFVWAGRMSQEKRPLEFIEAVRQAGVPVKFAMYGGGPLFDKVRRRIQRDNLPIELKGSVDYMTMLQAMAAADGVIQTSIGFETQGMTVFEAISLGTPAIISDEHITEDLNENEYWLVPEPTVEGLAATIRQAYNDITKGSSKSLLPTSRYAQSVTTTHMLGVYEDARRSVTQV